MRKLQVIVVEVKHQLAPCQESRRSKDVIKARVESAKFCMERSNLTSIEVSFLCLRLPTLP